MGWSRCEGRTARTADPLTRCTRGAVIERDPAFAVALLDEAATLILNGEPETARSTLRDLVNLTISFEHWPR